MFQIMCVMNIKKKTGNAIDEFGRPILYDEEGNVIKYENGIGGRIGNGLPRTPEDANALLYNQRNDPSNGGAGAVTGAGAGAGAGGANGSDKKEYKPTDSYRPTGNLVYNQEYFQKLENRLG